MIRWCISWVLKMILLVLAYASILYGVTLLSSDWASTQTMAILSKYAEGNWVAIGKSIAQLFPYLSELLDTLLPFLELVKSSTIESPLGIVYDFTNALILACSFKLFELIYQGIILPISNSLIGMSNRLADLWASVIGAYSSLLITDITALHLKSFFNRIYQALPFQILPNLSLGAISVVGIVSLILLFIVVIIWLIGRRSTTLMNALGKGFFDMLLGLLISAMMYLLAGSVLTIQLDSPSSTGSAAITMISCIMGITVVSAILFKNSVLKCLK